MLFLQISSHEISSITSEDLYIMTTDRGEKTHQTYANAARRSRLKKRFAYREMEWISMFSYVYLIY